MAQVFGTLKLGEWIASRIFDIALEDSAATQSIDGKFRSGALQSCTVNMQEIDGQDSGGLRVQELPPGRAIPARRRVDARGAEDLVDRGYRDRGAQLSELAVNAPVAPERILVRQADGELGDAPDRRRPAGLRRLLVLYFMAASLRCQASSVAGVTGRPPPSVAVG